MVAELSFYIHIPFCKHKCPYCHFYVTADKEHFKDLLLTALEQEWQLLQPILDQSYQKAKLFSIYFGGGTPTLFGPKRLEKVLSWIEKRFAFHKDLEISIESNPEDDADYRQLRAQGYNRVSLGVQSLDTEELHILDRRHSPLQAIQTVEAIRHAGFDNISIDLMYELPKQTLGSWEKTLKAAVELPITHLSLYNLTIEPHTPFQRRQKELKKLLPDEETSCSMYILAQKMLQEGGFCQYEISAFCRDNLLSKHNTGYWTGRHFFGLGPSAFSYDGKRRFSNVANLTRYAKLLAEGVSPVDFEDQVDEKSRKKELLAIHLRLMKGVDLRQFFPLEEETERQLAKLQDLGLIELTQMSGQTEARLTQRGILFYDSVASELI